MQLQLNQTEEKKTSKIVRIPQAHGTSQLNKKAKRWTLDVLAIMVVTAAVTHFEMSALNLVAEENAVGV